MSQRIWVSAAVGLCLTLGAIPAVHGQAQRWIVPPNVVDFTTPVPTVTPLPGPGASITKYTVANGVFDSIGNLLFFVVANSGRIDLFDAIGTRIDSMFANNFSHQIAVFAVPGNCEHYYIVYFHSHAFTGVDLRYSVVDIGTKTIVKNVLLASYITDSRGALAVSRLRSDGSRFLYIVASPQIQKFVVGPTGIKLDAKHPTVLDATSSSLNGLDLSAIQATLSSDGSKLAWSGRSPESRFFVANLDASGNYAGLQTFSGPAAGLEFSRDGARLFVSPTAAFPTTAGRPLYYVDLSTASFSDILGSKGYAGSLLQLAADGKIYAAAGDNLGAIETTAPSFKAAAVQGPGFVTGTLMGSLIGGSRTLPFQINGEAQLTCENLCGNPALVQGTFGIQGNFEVVVPFPGGGIAHYWRDNDAPNAPWYGPMVFATAVGAVDAVSMIQSNYGNLEVVARIGDRLAHFWRDSTGRWSPPLFFATGASGTPSFIQGSLGIFPPGNFELVTPLAAGGLAHYWRDNDPAHHAPWYGGLIPSTMNLGTVADVALVQGTLGVAGNNLELVARIGDRIAHFWRDSIGVWSPPSFFATGVSGTPSFIQGNYANPGGPGNFEVVTPLAAGGLAHYWRGDDGRWRGPFPFSNGSVRSVSLIQSNYDNNFELAARIDCCVVHLSRESAAPFTWTPPTTVVSVCDTPQFCGTHLAPPCDEPKFCNFPIASACGGGDLPGLCIDRPDPKQCPSGPPVCGCDGKTYASVCRANAAGESAAKDGPCPPPPDPCQQATHHVTNGGFEDGSFGAWNVEHGAVYFDPSSEKRVIDWTRTEPLQPKPEVITAASPLMSRQGKAIAPYCGTAMLRINNLIGDKHATRLSQKFKLPDGLSPCSVLRIHWGAMLHDGGHEKERQPFFEIDVLKNGNSFHNFRADATAAASSGWIDVREAKLTEPVWYRDALDLVSLAQAKPGDEIEIRLTAADCTDGQHGGAAFLDCIEILDRCANPCPFVGKQALGVLLVANFFSPNGDGIYDVWGIGNAGPACTASAKIYNRWGGLVAEPVWGDLAGAPRGVIPMWNGVGDNGTPAVPAVYYFILRVGNCSETRELPGFFHLFR